LSWSSESNTWLTTVGPDGAPQTTRVWFAVMDDRAWISTGDTSVKWRNLSRDPRVTLAFDGSDAGVVTGTAVLHTPAVDYPDAVAALAAKYNGWDATADVPGWGTRVLISVPIAAFRSA
jgi:PPOX class probable F420-dependent enzyme